MLFHRIKRKDLSFCWKRIGMSTRDSAKWATLVQNALNSYVVLYVVKLGLHRADKWLPWDESIHQKNHSGKVWIQGYSRLSCKGPLKLLNKRPRPKLEYCNNSVIFQPILMKFGMQLSYGPPFPEAKFQQGHKGQRPEGCKVKGQNFKKFSEAFLTITQSLCSGFTSIFGLTAWL